MLVDITTLHLDYHDTDRAIAAMEVNYPDGASTGRHAHPRGQLLHAIEGVMVVHSSAGSWVVPPNRALWLEAGLDHEVRMVGAVKIRTAFINGELIPDLPKRTCVVEVAPLLRELLVAAVQIPHQGPQSVRDERLLRLLVDELRVSDVLPLHLPLPNDPRIAKVCRSLIDQPAQSKTALEWSRRLNVTAKTLHRLFAKETGMSFAQWRQQARLLQALSQIAQGRRIIDVAADCGYNSQSAFTAMFRRQFGVPPTAFYE